MQREVSDFRADAALRSEALLEARGIDPLGDLTQSDCSLCVMVDPDGPARSRQIDWWTTVLNLAGIAIFFGCLALGAVAASWNMPTWVLILSLCVSGGAGVGMILIFTKRKAYDEAQLLKELQQRPNHFIPSKDVGADGFPTFFVIDMQQRKGEVTFAVFRDDQGVLVPDPVGQRLLIDSRGYRHIIYPQDITLLRSVAASGSMGVDVIYRVEGIEVALHIFKSQISNEFKAQLGFGGRNLIAEAAALALTDEGEDLLTNL